MNDSSIVECVPNFSEGRDPEVLEAIRAAMDGVDGAKVLDVDPGAATNRTVMTVVGSPDAVVEAAFQGIATAAQRIDMRKHSGEHARMGATDVCPFVPVSGLTMEDCAELARRLGQRVGDELKIPVFLYENAASRPERKNLANVRSGEYEGLAARLGSGKDAPDFGPDAFPERSGATAIGARAFLVAYNVNLDTRAKRLATEVALEVREQGRNLRGPDGKFVRDEQGVPVKRPGRLPSVKAVGWFIEEYGRAQVSCNLTDLARGGLHDVFDACDEEARKIGVRVTGSELIGLVPLSAMLSAGRHALTRQGVGVGQPEARIIEAAIRSLGLDELSPFDPAERIIEYRLDQPAPLAELSLKGFADELSTDSPAPGGGSVAAMCGAMAGGLVAMVANLTIGKKKHKAHWERCIELADEAQQLKAAWVRDLDADTAAFDELMAAMRLPKDSKAEQAVRAQALDSATRNAIEIPLRVLERSVALLPIASEVLDIGNPNAASDAACAAAAAIAASESGHCNVLINLGGYEGSAEWARSTTKRADDALERVRTEGRAILDRFRAAHSR